MGPSELGGGEHSVDRVRPERAHLATLRPGNICEQNSNLVAALNRVRALGLRNVWSDRWPASAAQQVVTGGSDTSSSEPAEGNTSDVILYPAIDLKDGQCVRLKLGRMDEATVFNNDPAAQAATFEAAGFEWLHLVDLNGAFAGEPVNAAAVEAILATVSLPVQLGGGIRDHATIERWLEKGISRVILGTAAVRDPDLVRAACLRHPGRIAVGIDARGGKVAVEGWAEESELAARDLALRFADAGVAAIIYTDIDRDGVLKGLNLEATRDLAAATSIPVIASGGLASLADIEALLRPENAGIAGAISGRAIYDGRLDPTKALALIRSSRANTP